MLNGEYDIKICVQVGRSAAQPSSSTFASQPRMRDQLNPTPPPTTSETMADSDTVESRVFRSNYSVLIDGLQNSLSVIVPKLYGKGVIGGETRDKALSASQDKRNRAIHLVNGLESAINTGAGAFHTLLEILEVNPALRPLAGALKRDRDREIGQESEQGQQTHDKSKVVYPTPSAAPPNGISDSEPMYNEDHNQSRRILAQEVPSLVDGPMKPKLKPFKSHAGPYDLDEADSGGASFNLTKPTEAYFGDELQNEVRQLKSYASEHKNEDVELMAEAMEKYAKEGDRLQMLLEKRKSGIGKSVQVSGHKIKQKLGHLVVQNMKSVAKIGPDVQIPEHMVEEKMGQFVFEGMELEEQVEKHKQFGDELCETAQALFETVKLLHVELQHAKDDREQLESYTKKLDRELREKQRYLQQQHKQAEESNLELKASNKEVQRLSCLIAEGQAKLEKKEEEVAELTRNKEELDELYEKLEAKVAEIRQGLIARDQQVLVEKLKSVGAEVQANISELLRNNDPEVKKIAKHLQTLLLIGKKKTHSTWP